MFITLEGIDGCGKSTQAKMLYELFAHKGALLTREPGGWDGAAALRELVLDKGLKHPWSELFLFLLDRAEHCARLIEPALAQGRPVICERYQDSTIAYQCWGRGMEFARVLDISSTLALPAPDCTVYFKIEPELALSRVNKRGRPDAFEKEGLAFMKKIDAGYAALAAKEPARWLVIECREDGPDEIFKRLKGALCERGLLA